MLLAFEIRTARRGGGGLFLNQKPPETAGKSSGCGDRSTLGRGGIVDGSGHGDRVSTDRSDWSRSGGEGSSRGIDDIED